MKFLGTVFLKAPALRLARFNSQFAANNTYLYTYNYRGQFTRFVSQFVLFFVVRQASISENNCLFFRIGFGSHYPFDGGIHHSDDNINLFTYPDVVPSLNTDDTEMSRKMVNFWTSFAAMGQPKACRDCEEDKIPWLPFSGKSEQNNDYVLHDGKINNGKAAGFCRETDERFFVL